MSRYWYTVEYDENSIAWLWDKKEPILCLEHGMQLDVRGHRAASYQTEEATAPTESPEAGEES